MFARRGWRVGLIARSTDTLDATRKDVVTAGGTASIAVADVADSAALEAAAAHIEGEFGPIDVWVNNAGVGVYGKFMDIAEDEFRRLTETNYFGTVNGTRVVLRRMRPRNRGTVVQILSAISYRGVGAQQSHKSGAVTVRDPNLNGPGQRPSSTHGPFDSESLSTSAQMWANKNRGAVGLALGVGLIGLALLAGSSARAAGGLGASRLLRRL